MDVKVEGYGRITEFVDTVEWLEPTGNADFKDAFSESADVGDYIDIAGLRVLGAEIHVPTLVFYLPDPLPDGGDLTLDQNAIGHAGG